MGDCDGVGPVGSPDGASEGVASELGAGLAEALAAGVGLAGAGVGEAPGPLHAARIRDSVMMRLPTFRIRDIALERPP